MFQETDKWFYAQVVKPDFGVLVFGVLRGKPVVQRSGLLLAILLWLFVLRVEVLRIRLSILQTTGLLRKDKPV